MTIKPFYIGVLPFVLFLAPLGSLASPLSVSTLYEPPASVSSPIDASSIIENSSPEVALRSQTLASLEADAFRQINRYRTQKGLSILANDSILIQQAREHSRRMVASRRLSHDGFDQRFQRIAKVLPLRSMAENVANNYGYANPAQVAVKGWIKSPGHHSNIVGKYNRTGVGVAVSPDGNYFFTQLFVESR